MGGPEPQSGAAGGHGWNRQAFRGRMQDILDAHGPVDNFAQLIRTVKDGLGDDRNNFKTWRQEQQRQPSFSYTYKIVNGELQLADGRSFHETYIDRVRDLGPQRGVVVDETELARLELLERALLTENQTVYTAAGNQDNYRYLQEWKRQSDGSVSMTSYDIATIAGKDLSHQQVGEVLKYVLGTEKAKLLDGRGLLFAVNRSSPNGHFFERATQFVKTIHGLDNASSNKPDTNLLNQEDLIRHFNSSNNQSAILDKYPPGKYVDAVNGQKVILTTPEHVTKLKQEKEAFRKEIKATRAESRHGHARYTPKLVVAPDAIISRVVKDSWWGMVKKYRWLREKKKTKRTLQEQTESSSRRQTVVEPSVKRHNRLLLVSITKDSFVIVKHKLEQKLLILKDKLIQFKARLLQPVRLVQKQLVKSENHQFSKKEQLTNRLLPRQFKKAGMEITQTPKKLINRFVRLKHQVREMVNKFLQASMEKHKQSKKGFLRMRIQPEKKTHQEPLVTVKLLIPSIREKIFHLQKRIHRVVGATTKKLERWSKPVSRYLKRLIQKTVRKEKGIRSLFLFLKQLRTSTLLKLSAWFMFERRSFDRKQYTFRASLKKSEGKISEGRRCTQETKRSLFWYVLSTWFANRQLHFERPPSVISGQPQTKNSKQNNVQKQSPAISQATKTSISNTIIFDFLISPRQGSVIVS